MKNLLRKYKLWKIGIKQPKYLVTLFNNIEYNYQNISYIDYDKNIHGMSMFLENDYRIFYNHENILLFLLDKRTEHIYMNKYFMNDKLPLTLYIIKKYVNFKGGFGKIGDVTTLEIEGRLNLKIKN